MKRKEQNLVFTFAAKSGEFFGRLFMAGGRWEFVPVYADDPVDYVPESTGEETYSTRANAFRALSVDWECISVTHGGMGLEN